MRMNWRTITLRTVDNNHVVVSNANTARHDIINYSRPTVVQRCHTQVGLSYAYPPGEVKKVCSWKHPRGRRRAASPPPEVLLNEFADSVHRLRRALLD